MDDQQNTPQEPQQESTDIKVATQVDQSSVLVSLGDLIKSNIASIDKLKEELTKHKQMVEDVFVNDATYQEHAKRAKEATKLKSQTRQQLMKQPSVERISSKIKSISADLKEKQISMSEYLQEYQRMSGTNEIEGYDGEVREIVNTAKVIKKSSRFKS